MNERAKRVGYLVLFTVIGFLLGANAPIGQMLWPPDPMNPAPSSGQLPFFMLLGAIEAIAFGVGVTFLLTGLPAVKRLFSASGTKATVLHLALSWLLVNWVIHDSLHMNNGMNMQGLLYIEYGFHVTLILAGIILLYHVMQKAQGEARGV